ncbi:MAG: phosphoethanolamine--lipid A transferase [Gammaproteobacteria bacterium]|nr:phosphoethanolamine--lipid A transferase [Gammaproteobacteria bacterium]MDH5303106.1 phosphoethanolamine--lipid A transferase [Gammaproteobacteria bacterium]MDH5323150.1 phosphoethanolamine--lipid A transferase [Gammaproteobacteria bacterium]
MKHLIRKPEALIFLFCLWVMLTSNDAYWRVVAANDSADFHNGSTFIAAIGILTLGLISLVMLLLALGAMTRSILIVALMGSAAIGYFTSEFGVLIDPSMLINAFETDTAEAADLLTTPLIVKFLLFGVLPASVVWKYPLERRRIPTALRDRTIALLLALSMIAGPLYFSQKEVVSFGRNHREAQYMIAPINAISSGISLVRDAFETPPVYKVVGADAVHLSADLEGRRPRVHALILGETARAANFSLGGYSRSTNPELQQQSNLLYLSGSSCGTATATSLPCMLTLGGRTGFERSESRYQDNLLDIAARSGYSVYWVDNGNGCKGLCDRVDHRDVHQIGLQSICSEDACYDEVLIHELSKLLQQVSRDTLIVLHQMGSHGPAYFRRYPDEFRTFVPDCRSQNFGDCSIQEIVNAYDNTIRYTDHVIAAAIEVLNAESERFDVSLTYVSDHGESLGEHNLFLHGMPYKLAPEEQKQVPFITWSAHQDFQDVGMGSRCLGTSEQPGISHDNLFHTELGLLDIDTSVYDSQLDIFSGCRAAKHLTAASL